MMKWGVQLRDDGIEKSTIPYQRIEAASGTMDCGNDSKCLRTHTSDSWTSLRTTTDNVKNFDLDRLQNALFELLPSDSDVVRLDCGRGPSAAVDNNETWYTQSLLASQHWNWRFVSHLCQRTIADEAMFDSLLVLVGHGLSELLLYMLLADVS
jgi:hypothetical protein